MQIGNSVNAALVTNHWGWTPRGIVTWFRRGWGWFDTWGVERSPDLDCLKIGPVVLSWPCPNRGKAQEVA